MTALVKRNQHLYNFKSTGQRTVTRKSRAKSFAKPKRNIGIATPVQLSYSGDSFIKMHQNLGDQLTDNLRQLILTNHGERLGLYDYGANLMELCFELQSEGAQGEAMTRITEACSKYMKFIRLSTFETYVDHFDNKEVAKIRIKDYL